MNARNPDPNLYLPAWRTLIHYVRGAAGDAAAARREAGALPPTGCRG